MTIRASWSGVSRQSGRPLTAADIERYELTVKRDGTAVAVSQPSPAALEISFPATAPGVYAVVLVCVPKRGGASAPVSGSVEIFDTTQIEILDFKVEVSGL